MHARDITPDEFETLAAELTQISHQGGAIEVVRGRHKDHGAIVIIRDLTRCMALIDKPAFLDQTLAESDLSVEGAIVGRAMRARH